MDTDILALAIRLLNDEHMRELQEASYSKKDRLVLVHEEHPQHHIRIK